MLWHFKTLKNPETLPELESTLLANRKVTEEQAAEFFAPPHPTELSFELLELDEFRLAKAVQIIKAAIADNKKIVIFGDYDADGICATAVLWLALKKMGCIAQPFIPKRDVHGYGLSIKAAEEVIASHHPDLIITVDNGIVAQQAAEFVLDHKIELIITDHHQPEKNAAGEELLPAATAIVHTTQLCGTTVAWILAQALTEDATELLDLCGIATIADQVPLLRANRSFAAAGIAALKQTERPGLLAVFSQAQIEQKKITEQSIGYGIAPRINAMGRLAHGMDALRLLCTGQVDTATRLAKELQNTNLERQDLTQEQLTVAVSQVSLQTEEHISIAYSEHFHEGVIGLLAGRLVEQFSKPAVVISTGGEILKGSARSIKGVNITDLLRSVREELVDVGGHPMAGGFSVKPGQLEVFSQKLFAVAHETITVEQLEPSVELECVLPDHLVTKETVRLVQQFAPFGAANTQPVFAVQSVTVMSVQTLGKEQQHLKFLLEIAGTGEVIEALWWRAAARQSEFTVGQVVSVAGKLEVSTWKQKEKLQLIVQDVQTIL